MPCIVVQVNAVDEEHPIPDLNLRLQSEVEVDLLVVLPDLALPLRLLVLVVSTLLNAICVVLALAIDPVYGNVELLKVVGDQLHLIAVLDLLVGRIPREDDDLEVLREVLDPIDSAYSNPHAERLVSLTGLVSLGLAHQVILSRADALVFKEVTHHSLEG